MNGRIGLGIPQKARASRGGPAPSGRNHWGSSRYFSSVSVTAQNEAAYFSALYTLTAIINKVARSRSEHEGVAIMRKLEKEVGAYMATKLGKMGKQH